MKKTVSILLVFCFCLGFAACGSSAKASSATPATDVAASAAPGENAASAPSVPAASAQPTPAPTPETANLQSLVDSLNEEELAQRTEEDPSVGVFELGTENNTIIYKFAMHIFQYVILMAQSGDAESVNAYNRLLESLPALEDSLEKALGESQPGLKIKVYLMNDEVSSDVAAVVENGEIVYDLVNGVGTAPENVKPIVVLEDLPPELQAELDQMRNSLNGEAPAGTAAPASATPAPAANNG